MRGRRIFWPVLMAALALDANGRLLAGDLYNQQPMKSQGTALPKSSEVQTLTAHPAQLALKGSDAAQQLVITAGVAGGRLQDLTEDVQYEVADPKIARVSS